MTDHPRESDHSAWAAGSIAIGGRAANNRSTGSRQRPEIQPALHSGRYSYRMIRSATLLGYCEAASSVGLDPNAMLKEAGLETSCMRDLDAKIPLDAYLALLAASAARARCGDFGARAAAARGLPDYGLVSLAMREAETIRDALAIYTRYLRLHCDDIVVELDCGFDTPFIKMELPGNSLEEITQVTQFCAVGIITQLRWLTGSDFQPVLVSYAFPRPASTFAPLRFSTCEVVYNQTVSGLVVDRKVLSRPVVTSDPRMRRIALQQLAQTLTEAPGQFVAKVHEMVRRLLPEDNFCSEAVAARFGIDRRTLNRRLAREGETFSSIVQQVRLETTIRALNGSPRPLTEIADLVGFECPSSFSRWFQDSFGCTARDWRRGSRGRFPTDALASA